jgi:hypothetical protein
MAMKLSFAAALVAASTLLGACFDASIDGLGAVGYKCTQASDCVKGFVCVKPEGSAEGDLGACARADDGELCTDRDADGFFAGLGCDPTTRLDCNDDDANISPGGAEVCNGIDDDCNDTVDDLPDSLRYRNCPKQIGICAGARVECTAGVYPACATGSGYPDTFEANEVSCDGVDNNCDGSVDESCECQPGTVEPCRYEVQRTEVERTADGECDRGVQFCVNGARTVCLDAPVITVCANGASCSTSADCGDGSDCRPKDCSGDSTVCGEGAYCVQEVLVGREDLTDECQRTCQTAPNGDPIEDPLTDNCVLDPDNTKCVRSVCRATIDGAACDDSTPCGASEECVEGICRQTNRGPTQEACNGLDDNCDGVVDNVGTVAAGACAVCPFNMVKVDSLSASGSENPVCIDQYEASRPDATATSAGSSEWYAASAAGVLPWTDVTVEEAASACQGETIYSYFKPGPRPLPSKRLCKYFEYEQACGGRNNDPASDFDYPYTESAADDRYVAGACIDGSLDRSGPAVTGTSTCAHAFNTGPGTQVQTYDLVGNVAEWVQGSGGFLVAGGSFLETPADAAANRPRTAASGAALSCTDLGQAPADGAADDIGFRCCTAPRAAPTPGQ